MGAAAAVDGSRGRGERRFASRGCVSRAALQGGRSTQRVGAGGAAATAARVRRERSPSACRTRCARAVRACSGGRQRRERQPRRGGGSAACCGGTRGPLPRRAEQLALCCAVCCTVRGQCVRCCSWPRCDCLSRASYVCARDIASRYIPCMLHACMRAAFCIDSAQAASSGTGACLRSCSPSYVCNYCNTGLAVSGSFGQFRAVSRSVVIIEPVR